MKISLLSGLKFLPFPRHYSPQGTRLNYCIKYNKPISVKFTLIFKIYFGKCKIMHIFAASK